MNNRRPLPALDNAKKLNNPDLTNIGDRNYTDTILRYGGLATKFPQLHTEAKTIIEAINEIADNPPTPPIPPTPAQEIIYYLAYESTMGVGSGALVSNNITNLLAWAFTNDKDLIIEFKVGASTASWNIVIFHFYRRSDYFRCRVDFSRKEIWFQSGGSGSYDYARFSYIDTLPIKLRFNHVDNSIDCIQEGQATQHIDWPFPFDTDTTTVVSGATSIYADQDWLEYLKISGDIKEPDS